MQQRGLYPINHLVVIKDEVLRARPEVATEVFDAFARAKQLYVERLRSGAITDPTATDRMYARVMESTGADPLPYGIAPNRKTLDELLRSAVGQKILDRPPAIEEVFAQDTLDLTA
jgi:4,5-dihydroxyphthalate decarboxylase